MVEAELKSARRSTCRHEAQITVSDKDVVSFKIERRTNSVEGDRELDVDSDVVA